MKEINCTKVYVPWYVPTVIHYQDMSVHLGFISYSKSLVNYLWFLFPYWLIMYQQKDCINYIPDYYSLTKGPGMGTKVSPFLGFVLIVKEGDVMNWMWWKHLKKYERTS